MFWVQQIKLLTLLLLFDDCIILILLSVSLLTPMPKLQPSLSERVVVDGHGCHTVQQFGVKAEENQDKVPTLYWLPKLHKTPIKETTANRGETLTQSSAEKYEFFFNFTA